MPDIGFARIQPIDLIRVDIEPDNRETLFRDGAGKRQSHIPQAANYDRRGFFGDARLQGPITNWFSFAARR